MLMVGVKAVLKNIKLPRLVIFTNELTGEKEFDLVEMYEDVSEREKEYSIAEDIIVPDIYVFAVLNNSIFLDPTEEEFSIASSIVIISRHNEKVTNVQSIGSSVDIQKLQDISSLIKSL
jgi:exosome complex RNA-binding protein Rrp42 (RNase PH superfamily)